MYIDGFLVPVPSDKKADYIALTTKMAPIWMEHGALHYVEAWGDDIPLGKVNDFHTAVLAQEGEETVFSWIVWPSKEARDAGNAKIMADERMKHEPENNPFDGKRMIYGGFETIFEAKA